MKKIEVTLPYRELVQMITDAIFAEAKQNYQRVNELMTAIDKKISIIHNENIRNV